MLDIYRKLKVTSGNDYRYCIQSNTMRTMSEYC